MTSQDNRHNQAEAHPDTGQTSEPGPIAAPKPGTRLTGQHKPGMSDPNVKMAPTET
jgi:hypothetical protein